MTSFLDSHFPASADFAKCVSGDPTRIIYGRVGVVKPRTKSRLKVLPLVAALGVKIER